MTEKEYIIATNRVKVSAALSLIRDTLGGDEYGVGDEERKDILKALCMIEEKLFAMIDDMQE